jgi:hypothetical protein
VSAGGCTSKRRIGMGVSETIVAAMIGAAATVTTALFQLFGAIRSRSKVDPKPRRGNTMRSTLAIFALMVASAAGGFLYSELLKQRHSEDIRAMRTEIRELKQELKQELAAANGAHEQADPAPFAPAPAPAPASAVSAPMLHAANVVTENTSAESIAYVPACRAHAIGAQCEESDAQRIALCGTIPSYAEIRSLEVFVQPDAIQDPWEEHRVLFEQDLGGAKFTGKSFEYAQGIEQKAVCVNFMHWSSEHPHIARLLVHYGFGPAQPALIPDTSFDELEPQAPVEMPAVIAGPIRE